MRLEDGHYYEDESVRRIIKVVKTEVERKKRSDGEVSINGKLRPYYDVPIGTGSLWIYADADLSNATISYDQLVVDMYVRLKAMGGIAGIISQKQNLGASNLSDVFHEIREQTLEPVINMVPHESLAMKMWVDLGSHDGSMAHKLLASKSIKGVIGVDSVDYGLEFAATFQKLKASYFIHKHVEQLQVGDLSVESHEVGGVLLINPTTPQVIIDSLRFITHSFSSVYIVCFVDDELKVALEREVRQSNLRVIHKNIERESGVYLFTC